MFPCLLTKISAVLMQCSLLKYVSKLFKCQQWVCGTQAGVAVAWTIGVLPTRKSSASHRLLVVGLPSLAISSSAHGIKRERGGGGCSQERKDRWIDRGRQKDEGRKCCVSFSPSKVCPLITLLPWSPLQPSFSFP